MKYRNIIVSKVKDGQTIPMMKWLRGRDENLTLIAAANWVCNLPFTFKKLDELDCAELTGQLASLVEFTTEIVTDTRYDRTHYTEHGYVHSNNYPAYLKDAEDWFDNLNEVDKERVRILRRNSGAYG